MSELLMTVHADKRIPINDLGEILLERQGDRKKFLVIKLNDHFNYQDYTTWGARLLELRTKYYSLLALDPTKHGIEIKVLP